MNQMLRIMLITISSVVICCTGTAQELRDGKICDQGYKITHVNYLSAKIFAFLLITENSVERTFDIIYMLLLK